MASWFKEESIPILLKLSPKREEEGTLLNSSSEVSITHHCDTKARQRHKKIKLQANMPDEYRTKNSHQMLTNQIEQLIKRIIYHGSTRTYPWDTRMAQHTQIRRHDTLY